MTKDGCHNLRVLLFYVILIGGGLLLAWYFSGFQWPRALDNRFLRSRYRRNDDKRTAR